MTEDTTPSESTRRSVTKDELLDLYQIVRSADTIALYDAAEAMGNNDVATACEKLAEAKTRYERRHARSLHRAADPRANSRSEEKSAKRRKKTEDALRRFDEYQTALQKMVKIQRATPAPKSNGGTLVKLQSKKTTPSLVAPNEAFLQAFRQSRSGPNAVELAADYYDVLPISTVADISENSLYLVRSKERWYLLRSDLERATQGRTKFCDLLAGKDVTIPAESLLSASKRSDAFKLRPSLDQIVLDESEMNVLWAIVRDTRLLPNASEITMIKKNELARKQYDRALKKMLLLQRTFNAAASTKRSNFRQELARLEAEKLTLSLREVEQRKLKIAQETRLIERAEAHFIKVMNSLHALNSRMS